MLLKWDAFGRCDRRELAISRKLHRAVTPTRRAADPKMTSACRTESVFRNDAFHVCCTEVDVPRRFDVLMSHSRSNLFARTAPKTAIAMNIFHRTDNGVDVVQFDVRFNSKKRA